MPYKDAANQSAASKRHYRNNKEDYIKRASKRNGAQRKKNRAFISRVKSYASCVDCGESNPIVLDFDHVRGEKVKNVSDMANASYSINSIKNEIRKCEVRCSNCHRKKTHLRRILPLDTTP
jgi:hypothetical protein